MKNRDYLCGILIFISFLITQYSYFIDSELFIFSGVFAWVAMILLFHKIQNKVLINTLIVLTLIGFYISYRFGFSINFAKVLTINQYLLVLLIGVGFLRLIATPKEEHIKALPQGKGSFFKTYLGIHLFGSVINLSSLILVADRLYKVSPLNKMQIVVLSRAFSSDAFWSPFFVAFAAAITYAPQLDTLTIVSVGLFLACCTFIITYMEIAFDSKMNFNSFKGYPIHFETLYLPFMLACLVLVTHEHFPEFKIIVLIALFSLLLSVMIVPLKYKQKTIQCFSNHILTELPNMKNELALFLIAGSFGVAVSTILMGFNIVFPFEQFDGVTASLFLLIMVLLSFIGIHPIISIAVIGNWMGELNHTLLAVTFLMAWSMAVSTSAFSGLNLTMQSRYELKAFDLFKANITYTVKLYLVCVVVLFLLSSYLNL